MANDIIPAEPPVRYIVGHGWADRVADTTALPHRVLRIDQHGDVVVRVDRRDGHGEHALVLQMSAAELAFLAREARRAARARFWARIVGRRAPEPSPALVPRTGLSHGQMENAIAIRRLASPMRHPDGSINASAVAYESTLREQSGLPAYIAELDGPGKVE